MNAVDELARCLKGASFAGCRNSISLAELREWAVEYLDQYDDELARFPKLVGQPHWNLWMSDRTIPDALFAVLVFRPDSMEFFCGAGDGFQIRDVTEHANFDKGEQMALEMKERFHIPVARVVVDRVSAEKWLGRSW
jgi:hypothetical protein